MSHKNFDEGPMFVEVNSVNYSWQSFVIQRNLHQVSSAAAYGNLLGLRYSFFALGLPITRSWSCCSLILMSGHTRLSSHWSLSWKDIADDCVYLATFDSVVASIQLGRLIAVDQSLNILCLLSIGCSRSEDNSNPLSCWGVASCFWTLMDIQAIWCQISHGRGFPALSFPNSMGSCFQSII